MSAEDQLIGLRSTGGDHDQWETNQPLEANSWWFEYILPETNMAPENGWLEY